MSRARELADLGNAEVTPRLDDIGNSEGALSNRNLVINGAMQVSQRGTSFTNHTGYTLDRWFNANPGTNTITQTFDTTLGMYYMGVTQSSGYGTLTRIEDKDVRHLRAGDVITISYWMDNEDGVVEFRPVGETAAEYTPTTIETSGSWFRRSASHTITAAEVTQIDSGDDYQINIEPRVNSYKLTGVQLEVGDVATPFEHRSYGDELAKCQRYYNEFGGVAYAAIATGMQQGTTISSAGITFPTMRAAPAIGFVDLIATDRTAFDEDATQNGSIAGTKSAYLRFTHAARGNNRDAILLVVKNGTSGKLTLDAEL